MVDISNDCQFSHYNDIKPFAVRVVGDSMYPQFEDQSVLICSTLREPKNRDFVLAYIHKLNRIVFRQLFLDSSMMILKSINPNFPVIQLNEKDCIVGIVIQVIKQY